MILYQSFSAFQELRRRFERKKLKIGFVPTLGSLHEGHLSLVRRARQENDKVIVSIFVNPLQFGPKEDFRRYPRSLKKDRALLEKEEVDILLVPKIADFYSENFQTQVRVLRLSQGLCGRSRPGHFAGVATVVAKLLLWVRPATLYLGQKDFQQCRVIEQMVEDLLIPVRVKRCLIVREKDGLAMSSRNIFLTPGERKQASLIYQALCDAEILIRNGQRNARVIRSHALKTLRQANRARVEYVEIVDVVTLSPMVQLKPKTQILIAVAAQFSKARLIDNKLIRI